MKFISVIYNMSADTSNQVICRQGSTVQSIGANVSLYNNLGGTLTATNPGLDNYIISSTAQTQFWFDSLIPGGFYMIQTDKQKRSYVCGYYAFENTGISIPSNIKNIRNIFPIPNSQINATQDGIIIRNPNNPGGLFNLIAYLVPTDPGPKVYTYRFTNVENISHSADLLGKIVNTAAETSVYSGYYVIRGISAQQITLQATLFSGNPGNVTTSGIICVFID